MGWYTNVTLYGLCGLLWVLFVLALLAHWTLLRTPGPDEWEGDEVLPSDMFSPDVGKVWEADEVRRLWPSARVALLDLAGSLARSDCNAAADQLRMAVQLADRQFDLMVALAEGGL